MQIRSEDHQALVKSARGVLGLLKEKNLLDDERALALTRQLDGEKQIPSLRKDARSNGQRSATV